MSVSIFRRYFICALTATSVLSAEGAIAQPIAVENEQQLQIQPHVDDGPALLRKVQDAFETLTDRLSPSVAAIRVQRRPIGGNAAGEFGIGTGFVIRPDGLILTCEHVVADAMAIEVTLHDGRRARARVLAADPRADLAVVQTPFRELRPARLGDAAELRRARIVLAFGYPLGLFGDGQAVVTQGLVSAIGRPLPESFGLREDRYYGDMIQISTAISPGHSGGPLVDLNGRVVGVITVGLDHRLANESIGFAIPINARTRAILDKLIEGRDVEYGYLGVTVRGAPLVTFATPGADPLPEATGGVVIEEVLPGGPAQHAGLQVGDVLATINGAKLESADQCIQLIGAIGPDRIASLRYSRRGEERTGAVKLVRRLPSSADLDRPALSFRGATLAPVPNSVRATTNIPMDALLVILVDEGSPAARAGLSPGDLVVRIEGVPLTTRSHALLDGISGDCLVGLANGGSVLVKDDGE